MLAARCRESGAAAVADRDAGTTIVAVASGDAIAIADAVSTTIAVTTTDSSTAAGSPPATATVRQCRAGCQGSNHRSEHEHSESCHVGYLPRLVGVGCDDLPETH